MFFCFRCLIFCSCDVLKVLQGQVLVGAAIREAEEAAGGGVKAEWNKPEEPRLVPRTHTLGSTCCDLQLEATYGPHVLVFKNVMSTVVNCEGNGSWWVYVWYLD